MKTILLTGFEPFGGESINPSWQLAKELDGVVFAPTHLPEESWSCIARQLPCVFGKSIDQLQKALAEHQPDIVIALGQAGGRTEITVERVAINVDDARMADNQGQQPVDQPIAPQGPVAYFSTLPIKGIVHALRQKGIPASVSQTAGTFVCNHVMYGLLHALSPQQGVKAGFIHLPYLPEQAAQHVGSPSMAFSVMQEALNIAIQTILDLTHDMHITGGAIC